MSAVERPSSCPTCGIEVVRAIAYGYPPAGPGGEPVEVEGVAWGGCTVTDPAAPEWRCSNGHEWRTTPPYPTLPPPDGNWSRALAELKAWREAFGFEEQP